jgi:folate-dependent tRNA-U54 methylase TrmFO/GidA
MLGALMRYLRTAEPGRFQPMNSNFGLLDPLTEHVRDKALRRQRLVERGARRLRAPGSRRARLLPRSRRARRPGADHR